MGLPPALEKIKSPKALLIFSGLIVIVSIITTLTLLNYKKIEKNLSLTKLPLRDKTSEITSEGPFLHLNEAVEDTNKEIPKTIYGKIHKREGRVLVISQDEEVVRVLLREKATIATFDPQKRSLLTDALDAQKLGVGTTLSIGGLIELPAGSGADFSGSIVYLEDEPVIIGKY